MFYYSKEWCDLFLQEDWTKGFCLKQNMQDKSLEEESLSSLAISGILLKNKVDKKPIGLTENAYLALSKAEKKRKAYFEKAKQTSYNFNQIGLPPDVEEMFDTWLFHDGSLLKLAKTGNSVELIVSIDGIAAENHPYRKLVFNDCICLLNELELPITVTNNEEGICESDYSWVYHEVCQGETKRCQIHIAVDRWRRMKAIVLEFNKCTIQECDIHLNEKGILVEES